jgi:hypothetical protein
VQVVANGPHDDFAGVESHAGLHLQAMGVTYLFGVAAYGGLHRQGSVTGPHGVVFMRHGCTKERHDTVAQHLVDGAFEAVHRVHHVLQGRVQEPLGSFRVETADQFRGAFEVGKQHGHLLPFAFERAAGGEDFLRQIRRGIDEGGRREGGARGRRRERSHSASPDQDRATLIAGEALALNEFELQILQRSVVQLELPLEGPIGQAAPLA